MVWLPIFLREREGKIDLTMTPWMADKICVIRESSVLWPFVWSAFQGINTVCCCFLKYSLTYYSTWCTCRSLFSTWLEVWKHVEVSTDECNDSTIKEEIHIIIREFVLFLRESWSLRFFREREGIFSIFRDSWKGKIFLRESILWRGIGGPLYCTLLYIIQPNLLL
jgi:hypothetical protein